MKIPVFTALQGRWQSEIDRKSLQRRSEHSETEDRSRTYGISNKERLLVVVHTERKNNVRIISARKATKYEKTIYEKE